MLLQPSGHPSSFYPQSSNEKTALQKASQVHRRKDPVSGQKRARRKRSPRRRTRRRRRGSSSSESSESSEHSSSSSSSSRSNSPRPRRIST
ncbi:MAG: hypothetical protein [Anelloviridae sp.]|nr:MAG: hypothetical protein [Anelloviridae sp.]